MLEDIRTQIADHWQAFAAATIIVTPFVYWFAKDKYSERIQLLEQEVKTQVSQLETKDAHVELLREEKAFLEKKLVEITIVTPPVNTRPSEGRPEPSPPPTQDTQAARLPAVDNPDNLTKSEVRALARFYGLFERPLANPHLRFKEGDISYWYEQRLSEEELKLEFETRRRVLDRSDQHGTRIPSQGDLSHEAEQLQSLHRSG